MMNQRTSRKLPRLTPTHTIDFHGASIIDARGNETPITEAMVQESLVQLIREWETRQQMHKR